MTGRLPPSLKWLIDKRARLDGEIKKMQVAAKNAKELIRELSSIREDLAAVDRALKLHIIQVETENIPPIRTHEKRIKLPHGELTRLLLTCLRQANGVPLSTDQITMFLADYLALAGIEEQDRNRLRQSVRYRLKRLAGDGVIQRHHLKSGREKGLWSLACSMTVFVEAHQLP
jgi:hypothetical protein